VRMKSKPQVVVIGLGAYLKKIRPGLSRYFERIQFIDVKPWETLDLLSSERVSYSRTSGELSTLAIQRSASCAMLLTPSRLPRPSH